MALTACKECKKEVSTKAKVCPYCGIPNPAIKTKDVIAGLVVLLVLGGIIASCVGGKSSTEEAASTSAAASEPKALALPPLPVTFTGAASGTTVTAENWPSAASISIAQSEDEKRYLADQVCLDEAECYGPKRFRRFVFKRYPDIARVTYRPEAGDVQDKDTLEQRKEFFFQGLYFAKKIQLANGQSLYDFMRLCSKGFSAVDGAEVGFDTATKSSYFDLQYFPVLRRADTGEPEEMQILLERRGDKIVARSPFFTTNALRFSDFLERHHLTCWSGKGKPGPAG